MNNKLYIITCFFNPCKFNSLLRNYYIFKERIEKQGGIVITIECSFNDDQYQIAESENTYRLSSQSIMWQKERLINYGISKLPSDCRYFAWIDCDVLFLNPDWINITIDKFKTCNVIQLFKKVYYLNDGQDYFDDNVKNKFLQSVIWQKVIHKNWLQRRINKELPFSAPGFAWAAKKEIFDDIGIYDKNIVGSGDTFLVDCYLDSWCIHGFASKFTEFMKQDMMKWREKLKQKSVVVDYIPVDIAHLWHGSMKNRGYLERHDIILKNNYDPEKDIVLRNNVYEWNSNKPEMHNEIKKYFQSRKEDEKQ